jgi:hypothetical protein
MYYSSMDERNNHSKVTDNTSSLTFTVCINMNIKAVIILVMAISRSVQKSIIYDPSNMTNEQLFLAVQYIGTGQLATWILPIPFIFTGRHSFIILVVPLCKSIQSFCSMRELSFSIQYL